ncbi:MAG: S8 family serine peptidase [Burkholderiaceae bacterium]|nr:S8 family serine peptidase [Burkholderiaceae bacterium]
MVSSLPRPRRTGALAARRLRLTAALAGLCISTGAIAQAQDWAPGRLLVMPRAGLSNADFGKALKPHGGSARKLGADNLHLLQLPAGASEVAVLAQLKGHPHLKFAELDRRVPSSLVANDPYLGSQWHLGRIQAPGAWDSTQGRGVVIAILDSGVLPTHPDLVQVAGWNMVDNNANTADVYGHGTAVAGSAAALTNNGSGVAGVAGAASIMPIRVSDSTGYAYYSTIASGLTWAADRGARVANASFSGVYSSSAVQSAAQYFRSKGGLVVVSAGNSGSNDGAPAVASMIPVSATDSGDLRASWSSYGSYVAVAAPGVGIWTTSSDGSYRAASGTSFSAPVTAGVLALMMAANPALSPAQVESLLYSTAVDLGTAGRDIYYGHGRIDALAAVAAAKAAVAVDSVAPTVAITSPLGGGTLVGIATIDVQASDNVGVTRVDLKVNGKVVASDSAAPYQFAWDSATLVNGGATLVADAYDAAGNRASSASVGVNVSNTSLVADATAPLVAITKPANNSKVSGTVAVAVSASDNLGATGLSQSLYLDDVLVASGAGGSLSYNWNTRKAASGTHILKAVARDAAGNVSTSLITVSK